MSARCTVRHSYVNQQTHWTAPSPWWATTRGATTGPFATWQATCSDWALTCIVLLFVIEICVVSFLTRLDA
jgi:hypothetical protein